MKHHFTKLVTFSFAAMLLASCSDSIDNPLVPNPGEVTKNILGEEVTSITDPQELAGSVKLQGESCNKSCRRNYSQPKRRL